MSNIARTLGALAGGRELGEFKKCAECKEYDWDGIHRCAQEWEAILFECQDEEDPDIVFCNGDAEQAAIKFAEEHFASWDYPRDMVVWVREDAEHDWKKYEITVESVPSFTAVECVK